MDNAQKKAGNPSSLSNAEKQANKRRTHKVRRQEEYREIGDISVERPEDLSAMASFTRSMIAKYGDGREY